LIHIYALGNNYLGAYWWTTQIITLFK